MDALVEYFLRLLITETDESNKIREAYISLYRSDFIGIAEYTLKSNKKLNNKDRQHIISMLKIMKAKYYDHLS